MTNEEYQELLRLLKVAESGNYHRNSMLEILRKIILLLAKDFK